MKKDFAFKDLKVWERAIEFADFAISITEDLNTKSNHFRLVKQFESARTSVSMNMAEGKGRRSKKEFIQYLYIARGSFMKQLPWQLFLLKENG